MVLRGVTVRKKDGTEEDFESEVLLDCSGMATFLANQRVTGPKYLGSYDKQIAFVRTRERQRSATKGASGRNEPG